MPINGFRFMSAGMQGHETRMAIRLKQRHAVKRMKRKSHEV